MNRTSLRKRVIWWREFAVVVGVLHVVALATWISTARAAEPSEGVIKSQSFDTDPGWEGFKNRMKPDKPVVIKQDFGYSKTNHAGGKVGEIGGTIQRAMRPAFYAAKIEP